MPCKFCGAFVFVPLFISYQNLSKQQIKSIAVFTILQHSVILIVSIILKHSCIGINLSVKKMILQSIYIFCRYRYGNPSELTIRIFQKHRIVRCFLIKIL